MHHRTLSPSVITLKVLGIGATFVLLVVGITSKGLVTGVVFYILSVAMAYMLYLVLMAIIGGAFTDMFRVLKADGVRPYAGEFGSPLVAVALVFITSRLFHHLSYTRVMYVVFLLYMAVHVLLLFIDRRLTRMAYLWSSLVLTEAVYLYALFRPY